MGFFYQSWKKGEDKYGVRENISKDGPLPWVDVQEKLFTKISQL